ncbi:MAG: hypothetical protein ACXWIH_12725, partial [Burkholderiales bacterium]
QFVSNLGKDYVVIEIGIFPKSETKLSPQDFTLRVKGEKDELPPADPTVMAAKINQKDQSGRDIDVYPTMGIEYRSADDPLTGERKGTRTSTGVVAEVHDRQKTPKTSQADEIAMQAELSEQALPEVTVAQPVAGYLYFSAPHGNSATYELTYHGKNGTVVVPLP